MNNKQYSIAIIFLFPFCLLSMENDDTELSTSSLFAKYEKDEEANKKPKTPEEVLFNAIATLNYKVFEECLVMYTKEIKDFKQDGNNPLSAILRTGHYISIQQRMINTLFDAIPLAEELLNQKTAAYRSTKKTTPLHIAVESLDFSTKDNHHYVGNILEKLLEKGADPYKKDDNGINAIDFADQKGYKDVCSYLKDKIAEKKPKSAKKSRCILS